MSEQLRIKFDARQPLVQYSDEDLAFLESTPIEQIANCRPFLIESRAKRLGVSPAALEHMLSYELARELADEVAILSLPDHQFIRPARVDWQRCDVIAKLDAQNRARDFEAWRRERRHST